MFDAVSDAIDHGEFHTFLSDVDAEYRDILYHSNVHWLSQGSVLQCFFFL